MATTHRSSSAVVDDPPLGSSTEQEHPLAEAGQEAGQTATHLADKATGIGVEQADRVRMQAADGIHQLASSVRRASTDLEADQPAIANLTTTAADGAERVAGFLRETDARQMVGAVEDIARRQPLIFVGGAFLLGIAASRFIKAAGGGGSTRRASYGGTSYGTTSYGSTDLGGYQATGPGAYRSDGLTTDSTDEGLRP
jgi:hypothetical protein